MAESEGEGSYLLGIALVAILVRARLFCTCGFDSAFSAERSLRNLEEIKLCLGIVASSWKNVGTKYNCAAISLVQTQST
jgi:hypothetical protein